jgi:hypothetical protein
LNYLLLTSSLLIVFFGLSGTASAIDSDNLTVNGYSSFEIERAMTDEGEGDPYNSFDADLLDLVFNLQVSNKVRVAADVTWEHGAASEDGRGNVAVEYGFSEYTVSDVILLIKTDINLCGF